MNAAGHSFAFLFNVAGMLKIVNKGLALLQKGLVFENTSMVLIIHFCYLPSVNTGKGRTVINTKMIPLNYSIIVFRKVLAK